MSPETPDLRNKVEDSRGLLKKIQLIVPGFRGYRQLEDLREADELLRRQVVQVLQGTESLVKQARSNMVNNGDYGNLQPVASLLSKMQLLAGEIMHAEQGYSGFSPAVRVKQQTLDSLYDYDYAFIAAANQLKSTADGSGLSSLSGDSLNAELAKLSGMVDNIRNTLSKRMEAVENIKVA